MNEESDEVQAVLKTKTCRGCSNRCTLDEPMCNRSKIWIKEVMEEINNKKASS